MNILLHIFRFIYRIRWWIIIAPIIVTAVVVWKTRNMEQTYHSDMTIYTGVVSGYGIESEEFNSQNWNILNNTLQNIVNIITSKETLKKVAIRLYARNMIHGNLDKDNEYIKAEHYKALLATTPEDVKKLIDKSSEDKTVQNLLAYEIPTHDNFIYGLFHYSYTALQHINVKRIDNSDILEVTYSSNDPGIVYQTLKILNEVYVEEYKTIQFGSTNNVIKYFEQELKKVGRELQQKEDSLTAYNIENRVINYDKQTEEVTSLDREYELRYQDVLMAYNSAQAAIKHLDEGLNENQKTIKSNTEFLFRLKKISDLSATISEMKTFNQDSLKQPTNAVHSLDDYKDQLKQEETDFKSFATEYSNRKYTKDGYPTSNFVSQWIDELLKFEKANAEIKVMEDFKTELDLLYSHFSPIGSTIKRQERAINFTEQSYLSILGSLNAARLRLKSLEMNSASLKVLNPSTFPLDSEPTKRKTIVAGAFFGSVVFIFGIFLLIELLDRTLRDRNRTESITSTKVLSAFPRPGKLRQRIYDKACREKAAQQLANQLYGYLSTDRETNIINLLSIDELSNSNEVAEELLAYWKDQGIGVSIVSCESDFNVSSKEFLFAQQLKNITSAHNDVVIVVHAPLKETPIPRPLLNEASINLLIVRADKGWKDSDQILLDDLKKVEDKTPTSICLFNSDKIVVEEFTGLLPPYSVFRKLVHRYYQLGLTSAK